MLQPSNGFKDKLKVDEKKKMMGSIFAFSYTWGMGGALDEFGKERLDDITKDVFKSVQMPAANTLFDYFYDSKKDKIFKPWAGKVPAFEFNKELPYFQLMVPTIDTVRYAYCLDLLLNIQKPCFFTGETGVGKSVIIQNKLNQMKEQGLDTININFSA